MSRRPIRGFAPLRYSDGRFQGCSASWIASQRGLPTQHGRILAGWSRLSIVFRFLSEKISNCLFKAGIPWSNRPRRSFSWNALTARSSTPSSSRPSLSWIALETTVRLIFVRYFVLVSGIRIRFAQANKSQESHFSSKSVQFLFVKSKFGDIGSFDKLLKGSQIACNEDFEEVVDGCSFVSLNGIDLTEMVESVFALGTD